MDYDFRWAIEEPIEITQITKDDYRLVRTTEMAQVTISIRAGNLEREVYFNGEYVDVGDDLMPFLCLLDQYHEDGGEVGKTMRQEPYYEEGDESPIKTWNEIQQAKNAGKTVYDGTETMF